MKVDMHVLSMNIFLQLKTGESSVISP